MMARLVRLHLPGWLIAGAALVAASCSSGGSSSSSSGHSCANACQHMIDCGSQTQSGYDACTKDCATEPWPQNYIDCRATTCGKTEKECETWAG